MRLHHVIVTNVGVQVTYVEEADVNTEYGIITSHTLDIPHEALRQDLLDDLVESARAIVEEARVLKRHPVESFRAAR